MNPEPLTCPYCNTLVPAAAFAPVGQRVPCPRCGDTFAIRRPPPRPSADLPPTPTGAFPTAVAAPLDVERQLRAGRNNRIVAGALLSVMACLAAVGLAFALYTTADRRAHDTALPPPPRRSPLVDLPPPAVTATAPAALEALRWLPSDCTLIAGAQFTELRQTAEGRDLLGNLFRIGPWEINADLLERWTGLKAREIDHVVVGLRAEEPIPPSTVVVVRTLRPYDQRAVKAALAAEPAPNSAGGKSIYEGRPADGGFRPVVWFADERTLVVGLMVRHVEAVPDRPAEGLERLPAAVREQVQSLLPDGPVWVVGHSPDWRRTGAAWLLRAAATEKDADWLGHVRGFALQLQVERPATLTAVVRCDGEAAAAALEARLTQAKPGGVDWKAAHEGPTATLQIRGDPAAILKELGK